MRLFLRSERFGFRFGQATITQLLLGSIAVFVGTNSAAADLVPTLAGSRYLPSSDAARDRSIDDQQTCNPPVISAPLDLGDVVEIALCNNPRTRQTWVDVKMQAVQVDIAKSAYMPSIEATGSFGKGDYSSEVKNVPQLDYQTNSTAHDGALTLNWTLYDFGLRQANLERARQLLHAANFNRDAELQIVFENVARAYFDLQRANATLEASLEAEQLAKDSSDAAEAKYKAGVGTFADKLQAYANYTQALLNHSQAAENSKIAHGTLAYTMGLQINIGFDLAAIKVPARDEVSMQPVDALIELAKQAHPQILSARAKTKAAEANVAASRAEGLPTVSIVGQIDRNEEPGQYAADTTNRTDSVSVQVKIPLLEGTSRSSRIQAAKVQLESTTIDVEDAEQKISLSVWNSYHTLQTETENLRLTEELLSTAKASFDLSLGRYRSGLGSIIELLQAQTVLTQARLQRIQVMTNWRNARITLAASLGRLSIQDTQ